MWEFKLRKEFHGFTSVIVIVIVALIFISIIFYSIKTSDPNYEGLKPGTDLQKNTFKQMESSEEYIIYNSDFGCNFSVEVSNQWVKEGGGDINSFVRFRLNSGDIRSDFIQIHCMEGSADIPDPQDHIPSDKVNLMNIVGEEEYTKSGMNFKHYFIAEEDRLYSFWTYIQPVEKPDRYVAIYTNVPDDAEPDPRRIKEFENYNRVVNSFRFN